MAKRLLADRAGGSARGGIVVSDFGQNYRKMKPKPSLAAVTC